MSLIKLLLSLELPGFLAVTLIMKRSEPLFDPLSIFTVFWYLIHIIDFTILALSNLLLIHMRLKKSFKTLWRTKASIPRFVPEGEDIEELLDELPVST